MHRPELGSRTGPSQPSDGRRSPPARAGIRPRSLAVSVSRLNSFPSLPQATNWRSPPPRASSAARSTFPHPTLARSSAIVWSEVQPYARFPTLAPTAPGHRRPVNRRHPDRRRHAQAGVHRSTVANWRQNSPEFQAAITQAQDLLTPGARHQNGAIRESNRHRLAQVQYPGETLATIAC